ncbi:DUF5801 repeats-in-toxin domain-containing protein [Acinetobacter sp. CIP 102129]|uniref:DUF5801 repeats-in-toxin domain-containing protein n=1 Tax=Acinetobacter sp. CIP 102129 TaxID=1144664 RepID=UPI00039D258F|nr:DUF5801 repeats-in-toxin domain-containing protein [Acinetobacter sp. CIP 102129]
MTVTEGSDPYATFTVSLSNPSSEPIVFNPTLSNGTAIVGTDTGTALEYYNGTSWVAVPAGGITFAPGQTSVQVRVAVTDDNIYEANETFNLTATVTSGTTANTSATGVGTITNDDAPTLLAGIARVSEEGLVGGLADSNGDDDLTNSRTFNGSLVVANVETTVGLTYAFTGVPSEALTSNGVAVVWTLVSATEVVGTANGIPVVSVILDSATGDYTVTLDKAVDHADNSVEDILDFTIPTKVTGNHNVSDTSTLKVIVEDDAPSITPTGPLPTLTVDDSALLTGAQTPTSPYTSTATASFVSAFGIKYGADGAGSTVYSLSTVDGNDHKPVDLFDAETGDRIFLYTQGNEVWGFVGTTALVAFKVSVDTNGNVTLNQLRAIRHTNTGSTDEASAPLTPASIKLTATVTDRDDDTDSETLNIGGTLRFLDDAPTITVVAAAPTLQVDESALASGAQIPTAPYSSIATADFSSVFAHAYGADGAGTLLYSLTTNGAATGLLDSLTNQAISLVQVGNNIVGRAAGNDVFQVSVDANGNVTLNQFRSIIHANGANPDDVSAAIAANAITLTAFITDRDGDSANTAIAIGDKFSFRDDAPSVSTNTVSTVLEVDETVLNSNDSENFASAFTVNYGADGAGSTVYSLGVTDGTNSGLVDVASGSAILLYQVSAGVVEGRVGGIGGTAAFRISVIDAAAGQVELDQIRALRHLDTANTNEFVRIDANTVKLIANVTDKDGDVNSAASIDLGVKVAFRDDAPTFGTAGTLPSLIVDESNLTGGAQAPTAPNPATASFVSAFNINYGADGGSTAYSLSTTNFTLTNLYDTATGSRIALFNDGGKVVGYLTSDLSTAAFDVSVDVNGIVTLNQLRAIRHTNTANPDEASAPLTPASIKLTALVTDRDGDEISKTLDIGGTVSFKDDAPTITPTNAAPILIVDETTLGTSVTNNAFGTSAFTVKYGADGAASTMPLVYSLSVSSVGGVSSALVDTATGQLVYLYIESGTGDVIGRVGSGGNPAPLGAEAFRIHVDASTGSTTLTQNRPLNHLVDGPTPSNHNDALNMTANLIRLNATATDKDGDVVTQGTDVGNKFRFLDDGLSLVANAANLGSITVDESALIGGVGNPDPTILATMTNSTFLNGVFTPTYGTDGQHAGNPLVYSLQVANPGVNSGLVDTATGQAIFLYKVGTDIVGRVGSNTGAEAFRIQMNATSGSTKLTQSRSLSHLTDGSTATDHNDALTITNSSVFVRAVAMDGDGDTAIQNVDIGNKFSFLDDGPVFTSSTTATVDEADLPLGSSPTPSALTQSGTLTINFGADKGTASQVDVQFTAATLTALENWDNTATGGEANNENLTFVISNAGHTITARDGAGAGDPIAFTVTLTVDKATGATSYQFVLSRALAHNNLPELHIPFKNLLITDGDGDTTLGNFSVTVVDDEPALTPKLLIVNEDLTNHSGFLHGAPNSNTFNTNADATGVNTAIDGGANAPQHGVAVVNANGTITYTPNTHYSGQDTFTYTTTTDQGTKTYTVNVTVRPITNDVPQIPHDGETNATHPHFVYTLEDTDVLLGLKAPVITDPTDQNGATTGDHPERLGVITLTLSGAGAVAGTELLNGGTPLTPTSSGSGIFTVVLLTADGLAVNTAYHHSGIALGNPNVNYLTVAQYEAIQASPALHRHENFNVAVSVTEYEVNDSGTIVSTPDNGTNGNTATQNIFVSVEAVTDDAQLIFNTTAALPTNVDAVTYVGNTTATVTIKEETNFNVKDILIAQYADLDGTEVRSITITNTTGQDIVVNGSTLANGASVTVNATGQVSNISNFPNITIGAAGDFSGDLNNIILTINAQDYDADGYYHTHNHVDNSTIPLAFAAGSPTRDGVPEADTHDAPPTDNNTVVLNLRVTPVAGDVAAGDVSTAEDTAVAFLQNVRVTDTGTGDERIKSVSFTVPTDWKVIPPTASVGWSTAGDGITGTYTITFADGVLTEAQRETILDQFMIQPPAHSSKDVTINVALTSMDTNTTGSDTATVNLPIKITVTPTAEALALTGNATITGLTTDYYATAADNPANWTAMNTDINAANGGLTPDLSMNGNFSYGTNGFEDTWFALNTDGFDFKTPWHNEDGVGSGGTNGNRENTFAVLTAYEVVLGAGGIITGLNPIAGEFKHSGSTAFASEVAIQFLDSVEFKGPEGFSGEVFIKVQARTKDYDEDDTNAEVIKDSGVAWLKHILLEPVADAVTLRVRIREVMDEDTSRALTIRTQTTDLDGSETFNIRIQGIPEGSKIEFNGHVYNTLNNSTWINGGNELVDQGGGLYTLQLQGLPQGTINPIFTPPKDSNTNGSNINLTVEAVSVDTITISGGPNAGTYTQTNPVTSTQTIAISVIGVPDAPLVSIVGGQTWVENNLDKHNGGINSAAANGDPNVIDLSNFITDAKVGETNPLNPSVYSETLTLRITNLPEGFSLVDAATGNPITTLGGSGDARVWVLTPAQIATTQIKTPVNFSGTENFTVQPVVTENDGRATKFALQTVEFKITPSPEATLNLSSNVWEDVDDGTYGHANQIGQISLSALPQNGDSTNEEIYAVRFSEAEVLAAGMILYSDAAGTTPLVATGGYYYVTGVANVQNVYVRSDENFSGDVALTVDYIVRDTSSDGTPAPNQTIYTGGGNAPTWTSFETINHVLHFRPLTDDVDLTIPSLTSPTATITGTHATLVGDGRVTVNLNTAKVPDATASSTIDYDGTEHMNYFLIQNVPDGVTVIGAVNTGGGQWLIIDTTSFTGALADSVQFDVNYAAVYAAVGNITDWPITITAVTQDGTAPEKTDTETWTLTTVAGPGGIFVRPEIDLIPLNPTKIEDTPFALSDVVSGDIDSSMATITSPYQVTLTIRMDPADTTTFTGMGSRIVVIEGGNPVAIWTKTFTTDAANADADLAAAIASVTVIPASDANRNTNNLNGPLPFDITASIQAGGATDSDQVVSNVNLTPVTDNATLTTTSTAVNEGGTIPVNVIVTNDKDETGDWIIAGDNLYLQVVDGPDTVVQGDLQYWNGASWITVTPTLVTGTGTTLDGQNYYIVPNVLPNTLQQLRYVVTNDAKYEHGTFTLNAFAINQEFGSTTLVSMGSTPLTVNPVNTPPVIDIEASGFEQGKFFVPGVPAAFSIPLNITKHLMPADPEVNENLYSALIQNLPNGFLVYYGTDQNSATLATNAGDGTWLIPVSGNDLPPYISIKPPAYWSGTLSSAVFSLVSGEASLPANVTDFPFNLIVTPVADGIFALAPTYSFANVGEPLVLNLNMGMQDPVSVTNSAAAPDEYHELTTLKFRNIPDGAATVFLANNALINPSLITYDAGTGEHTITGLTQAQLDNFQILHEGTAGRVLIEVDAQTYEVKTATGAVVSPPSAWVTKSFEINVTGGNRVDGTPAGDIMSGTADNDYINGHGGDDTISGGSGNDALLGETGNDILNGGDGTDYLYGGVDNDTLIGGAGNDILFGGTGADTFVWGKSLNTTTGNLVTNSTNDADGSTDIIKDFNLAEGDKVDAKALLDALGWNGNMATLSNYVSVSGNSINIHDVGSAHSVTIVVENHTFSDVTDMINKTNFQT